MNEVNDNQEEPKIYLGTTVFFSNKLNYGFIAPDGEPGQKDLFVHYSNIKMSGYKTLRKGQRIKFEIGKNLRNENHAINVEILPEE